MRGGLLLALLAPGVALANEPLPVARASFPLLGEAAAALPARESSLDRLAPRVVGAFPLLPPPATASPQRPSPASPAPALPEWEVVAAPARRVVTAGLPDGGGPSPPPTRRDRDRWMLSLEAATRAPVDAGLQLTFETPVGLRVLGAYGWVPSMYLGRVMGTIGQLGPDPAASAVLERGFESGRAWRVGAGWRPFRSVGVYLDAGYARVTTRGGFEAGDVTGIAPVSGSYAVESSMGLGFVEVGYQAKVAELIVLAPALGVTRVLRADTTVAPGAGSAADPELDRAASWVDQALERYGYLPTLTLRLGVDMV